MHSIIQSRDLYVTNFSSSGQYIAYRHTFSLRYRRCALITLQSFNANTRWFKVNVKHFLQPILLQ